IAFAPHLLDQDGNLHFSASAHVKNVRSVGLLDPQGDVGPNFLDQTLPNMSSRNQLAIDPSQRTVVDRELHLNRWRIDRHERKRCPLLRIGDRFADKHVLKTSESHHIPGVGLGYLNSLEAFEVKDGGDLGFAFASIAVDANESVTHLNLAAIDFAEGD